MTERDGSTPTRHGEASMTEATANIGRGIQKTSARPTKVVVDGSGNWWICDADADATKD